MVEILVISKTPVTLEKFSIDPHHGVSVARVLYERRLQVGDPVMWNLRGFFDWANSLRVWPDPSPSGIHYVAEVWPARGYCCRQWYVRIEGDGTRMWDGRLWKFAGRFW